MSNVKYLVFENSTNVLNMNKINVFKNGSEMPWTYYQADILTTSSNTTESEGRNRLMFTSESKPGPNGEKAGKYVSKIKKFTQFGNSQSFQEQTINNPTINDYKSWGWKLTSDPITGEEKLPEYGEFSFKPGMEPNYEDLSSMTVNFKFGFGLNNTCYNFATETVTIQVYNLSCQPKVFCTNNAFCEINYDAVTDSFGPDITAQNDDGTISCTASEGVPNAQTGKGYAYIMTAIESGEQLDVSFVNYGTESSKNQLQLSVENDEASDTIYTEESSSGGFRLSKIFRSNVAGDGTLNATGGIKYDFLRIKVSALPGYQNLKYNDGKLCVNLKLTPVAFNERLESFSIYVTVYLELTKDIDETAKPGIRSATEDIEGFKMNDPTNSTASLVENRRARLVVTTKEAINYAIKNNEGPSFIRGKTIEEAFNFYHRSMLTETEKNIDDYKKFFNSDEMIRKLAHFIVTDLSGTNGVAANQFAINGINQHAVNNILSNQQVKDVYNLLKTDLGGLEPSMENMPLSKIYEDANRSYRFQVLVDLIKNTSKTINHNAEDTRTNTEYDFLRPWVDAFYNTQRKFGELVDASASTDTDRHHELISNNTTTLALLYAINNYIKTGSDFLITKYINRINDDRSSQNTGQNYFIYELQLAMNKEYHGLYKLITPINSPSYNRPKGLFEELYQYRYQLNPVESIGARKYLNEMIEIKDVAGTDTVYYGTDEIYIKNNLLPVKAKQTEIEQLLYFGDVSTNIGSDDSALLGDAIFGESLSLTGILFQNNLRDTVAGSVFYTDINNRSNTNMLGQFRGSNANQFSKTLKANTSDISDSSLEGKWVLSTDGDMAKAYSEGNWHPENCDLSGVIKVPDASAGCYWDVFINGHEVKETIIDLEEVYNDYDTNAPGGGKVGTNYDLSNLRDYWSNKPTDNRYYKSQASSTKNIMIPDTLTSEFKKQYRYTNVGIYSFFRIGETIKFVANLEDLDADTVSSMKFPEIKIRERNDKNGICQTVISDAYIPLKDVESKLEMTINLNRDYGEGYDISNNTTYVTTNDFRSAWYWATGNLAPGYNDQSGILTSRWGTLCIPLDISGQLERGEEFKLSTKYDSWVGINDEDVSAGSRSIKAWDTMFSGSSDVSHQVPSSISEYGFKIEYQNYDDIGWTSVDDVCFKYECHNKFKTIQEGQGYTSDGSKYTDHSDNGGDKTHSSNIKGMPRFRICLEPQNKLLQYCNNFSNEIYLALGRKVQVNLKYNKSAKKNTNGTSDVDGNNKSLLVKVIVDNDLYNANITTQNLRYDRNDELIREPTVPIRDLESSTTYTTGHAYNVVKSIVGPGVKEGPYNQQQCVPDYTIQQVYNIQSDYYTYLGDDPGERSIDFRDVEFTENNHSLAKPISTISASNYKLSNGEYSCTAEIVPLFKFQQDENDFASTGTYCNIANNNPIDININNAPRLIPANTNYGIYATDNNTKFHLYRINNLNYEEWIDNYYDYVNKEAYREIVNVKLTYYTPSNNGSNSMGVRQEQQIVFLVEPKDKKEINYPENFHFMVNEGDKSVDITSILSATMEGNNSSDMEYYVRGAIDESGEVHMHMANVAETSILDFSANADASSLTFVNSSSTSSGNITGLTFKVNDAYSVIDDIGHTSNTHTNLTSKLVNGKLILYHKNHLETSTPKDNKYFDAYEKKDYKFFVVAKYTGNDQSDVENTLSLVTITVQPGATGFFLTDSSKWYYNVTETLGTLAEAKGLMGNNPDIPLHTFTENLRHEDIGESTILHNQPQITWRVFELDNDLMIVEGKLNADFSNQVIRLKDIDANKTTETATSESTHLAPYNHYNYERKRVYKVTLEVCLSNYQEICVEKVTNYICGIGETNSDNWTNRIGNDQKKTTTYLVKKADNNIFATEGPYHQIHNGKLYYFKDPETGLYQGPLSVIPATMSQLNQKTTVHGVTVRDAYVRFDQPGSGLPSEGGYQPLYKTSDFKDNLVKAPKPTDNCLQPFIIKVLDSYDKAKVCPQPYMITDKSQAYCTADPLHQDILDNELITTQTNEIGATIAYVYADHKEFQNKYSLVEDDSLETNNDLPNDFMIPSWHPLYTTSMTDEANQPTAVQRVIHHDCRMDNINAVYNRGVYDGTPDGNVNYSLRYGCYSESDQSDPVILDYFIEYHDKIDERGENEIALLKNGCMIEPPFGSRIEEYNGSLDISCMMEDNNLVKVSNSEHRIIRADNICRNRKHIANDTDNDYYATAEIDLNSGAQIGRTYQFTVVAVSNVLASKNDMKYNKNMVDWNQTFYPKIAMKEDGTTNGTAKIYPQPFQKYVYDASGERIVTRGYARKHYGETGGVDPNGTIKPVDDDGRFTDTSHIYEESSGTLLCCRSHFKVCVTNGTSTTFVAKSGNYESSTALNSDDVNLKFDEGITAGLLNANNTVSPLESINALNGDIRLFSIGNGQVIMTQYMNNEWTSLNY
jgi:hypothetical protein